MIVLWRKWTSISKMNKHAVWQTLNSDCVSCSHLIWNKHSPHQQNTIIRKQLNTDFNINDIFLDCSAPIITVQMDSEGTYTLKLHFLVITVEFVELKAHTHPSAVRRRGPVRTIRSKFTQVGIQWWPNEGMRKLTHRWDQLEVESCQNWRQVPVWGEQLWASFILKVSLWRMSLK